MGDTVGRIRPGVEAERRMVDELPLRTCGILSATCIRFDEGILDKCNETYCLRA